MKIFSVNKNLCEKKELDISQRNIITKCLKYVKIQSKIFPHKYKQEDINVLQNLMEGRCVGLVALWMYQKALGVENKLFNSLKAIAKWDESVITLLTDEPLKRIFEEVINYMNWIHHTYLYDDAKLRIPGKADFLNLIEILEGVKPDEYPSICQEFIMGFVFKKEELTDTLNYILFEDKMIRIHGGFHTVGVMQLNGKFCVYDPRSKTGEKVFNTISDLENHLEDILYTTFNIPLSGPSNPKGYMSIMIEIYRLEHQKPALYKKQSHELVQSYVKESGEMNRVHHYTHPYDQAIIRDDTPLILSAQIGDAQSVKELLKFPGIDLNKETCRVSAIEFAAISGNCDIVKLLLNAKAEPRHAKKDAIEFGYDAVAQILADTETHDWDRRFGEILASEFNSEKEIQTIKDKSLKF